MMIAFNFIKGISGAAINLPSYYKPELDIISVMHLFAGLCGYRFQPWTIA